MKISEAVRMYMNHRGFTQWYVVNGGAFYLEKLFNGVPAEISGIRVVVKS